MERLNKNRALVAIVALLVLVALASPSSLSGIYTLLGLIASIASIAFYTLGALWFWKQLQKKDTPKDTQINPETPAR
jgi:Na+/proline symporter